MARILTEKFKRPGSNARADRRFCFNRANQSSLPKNLAMIVFAAITLAACNKTDGNQLQSAFDVNKPKDTTVTDLRAYCPKLVLRAGTENFRTYPKGTDKAAADAKDKVIYQATITDTVRECKTANGMMTIRVGAAGRIILGPGGTPGGFTMPIRVAVTRGGDEVLYSTLHQVPGEVPPGRTNNSFSFVDGNVVIPAPETANIVVYVGFDDVPQPKAKKSS